MRAAAGNRRAVHADIALLDVRASGPVKDRRLRRDGDRRREVGHLEQQRRRSRGNGRLDDRVLPALLRLIPREDFAGGQTARAGHLDERAAGAPRTPAGFASRACATGSTTRSPPGVSEAATRSIDALDLTTGGQIGLHCLADDGIGIGGKFSEWHPSSRERVGIDDYLEVRLSRTELGDRRSRLEYDLLDCKGRQAAAISTADRRAVTASVCMKSTISSARGVPARAAAHRRAIPARSCGADARSAASMPITRQETHGTPCPEWNLGHCAEAAIGTRASAARAPLPQAGV